MKVHTVFENHPKMITVPLEKMFYSDLPHTVKSRLRLALE